MTKTLTPAKTPTVAIARVLRDLGLKQGRGKDFAVTGFYSSHGREFTYVVEYNGRTDEVIAANADLIEQRTAETGFPFTVSVRYSPAGYAHTSVTNGCVERIREDKPAENTEEQAMQDDICPDHGVKDDECESEHCADCGALRDNTWPFGSDVCGRCWDAAEADDIADDMETEQEDTKPDTASEAVASAPPNVRFVKVSARSWGGNGFGTDPAHWDAVLNGEVIARWRPTDRRPKGEIYGERTFAIHGYRQWREAVMQAAAGRHAEAAPEPSLAHFAQFDRVWITYPDSINADRDATVVADDGGAMVTVRWQARRKIRAHKGTHSTNMTGTGNWHEQRIPRDRLKPRRR